MTTDVEVHQETALFAVTPQASGSGSSTAYNFIPIIDTISRSGGEKDGEGRPVLNGGRVWVNSPESDYEVSLEAYELMVDSTQGSNGGFSGFYHGTTTADDDFTNSRTRPKFRVAFLMTNSSVSDAEAATAAGYDAYRWAIADARFTAREMNSVTPSEPKKWSITIKAPAYDRTGASNVLEESKDADDAAGLAALGNYNESQKWTAARN